MKVLLQIRADYRERPGGDATQAARTTEELRALGIEANLVGGVAPDLAGYDLVHIFNTQVIGDPVRQAIRARSWGLPVVLSTIYWNPHGFRSATRGAADAGTSQQALDRAELALQRLTLGSARLLLPNSQAEAAQIAATFPGLGAAIRVVPNAVDARFATGDGARFCAAHGLEMRGFVLCAGRKEALKNQLGLIRACRDLELPLVLAGQETEAAADYVAACRALAAESSAPVLFLPNLSGDDLADAFAAARVHVQPSFYETVGLSSLEAALGGCNVVTTANSGAVEYLGDAAWYCDPASPDGIFEAVAAAWSAPLRTDLGPAIAARHTWRRAAEETLRGYEEVLQMPTDEPTTRWLPDLATDDYIAHLEALIQLQLEATAARDQQYSALEASYRHLHGEFQALQGHYTTLNEQYARQQKEQALNAEQLTAGLTAEATERQRTEEAFRALEAAVTEQQTYVAKLEAELAARPPASAPSRWPLRRNS